MVEVNIGIYPNKGEMAVYDSIEQKLINSTLLKVTSNDLNKVKPLFEKIASLHRNLGCACICLEANYGNKIRQNFIETALDKNCGFKSVEIIDWKTAVYLNAISQSNYKLKNNDIIWIFTGYSYHIWQYKSQKVKHIFSPKGYYPKMDDFENIKVKSKLNKDPNLVLFKKDIEFDEKLLIEKFKNCQCIPFKQESYAEGACVKAQIMAKSSSLLNFDVDPIFDQWITVKIEKTQIFYLKNFETLPFKKSIVIKKDVTEKNLKVISHGINDINPEIEIQALPYCEVISVSISFDINGIYSVGILPLDSNQKIVENKSHITHCVGVDFLNSEIATYDLSTKQTSKVYLNKTSNVSRNVEFAFTELVKVITFLPNSFIVFHVDDECYNHILVGYHENCEKHNLKNFAFISSQTAELLNILNEHQINDSIKTIAFISDKNAKRKIYCQIWKRDRNIFKADKSYIRFADPGADDKNLEKLMEESKNLDGIDLAFIDSLIDENVFKKTFNVNYKVVKNGFSFAEAAVEKARALMGKKQNKYFDVENNLNRRISVIVNNVQMRNFAMGISLPFIDEVDFKSENCKNYKICERNANGTKYESECHAPARGNWKLKVHCNVNGILSVSYHLSDFDFKNSPRVYDIPQKMLVKNLNINAVGIDLGMSRCCVAVNRKDRFELVALENSGDRQLPSHISFKEEDPICGQLVVNQMQSYANSTVFDIKRIIGRNFKDVQIDATWPFEVIETDINKPMIRVQGYDYIILEKHPEEITAVLLKHMKQKVEEFQGKSMDEVVITVPAAFDTDQKISTHIAAELAGWRKVHLLSEPIAASIAYFVDRPIPPDFKVLLFDIGGGTLDLCIFRFKNNKLNIVTDFGDSNLGGRDFDSVLYKHFAMVLESNYQIAVNEKNKYRLMLKCQEIKHTLSVEDEAR
uniref:Uncharacterized protein n=1 Tax=Panagrolaimus davidi TaxID=227884 RepID=A0A914PTC0_9BILA